jgi:hypothetical protein
MKNKIFRAFTVSLLLLSLTALSLATKGEKEKHQGNQLVSLLPASDAVVVFDVKRFFSSSLPQIMTANQPLMSDITAKLDELQQRTGIDIRQFESVAAGLAMKAVGPKETDYDPVIIARGTMPAGGLVAVVKLASNGTYKEEKIGTRTVYIFSAKDIAQKQVQTSNSKITGSIDRAISGLHEIAVTAIDNNTLAFGSVARVRQAVAGTTHVDAELNNLLGRHPGTLASFAAKTPSGLGQFLPLENDELGKTMNSVRFLAGSMDVTEGQAVLDVMARTTTTDSAQSLLDTLQGLQTIGKAFLGGAKGPEKAVYARMIDNAKFARNNNEVTLDLAVPQSDIDILIGSIK